MDEYEQISFALDDYNDLFSDFDNREYSKRALSDDFLNECKKASLDKKNQKLELLISLPSKERNVKKEEIISERLKGHFSKHYHILKSEKSKYIKNSIVMIFLGVLFSVANSLIHFYCDSKNIVGFSILLGISEPASWFLIWEGMNKRFFIPIVQKSELEFYKKMSKISIIFNNIKE
jgi:hypothetical protein